MTIYQKIAVALGAIALIVVVLTAPKYLPIKGLRIPADSLSEQGKLLVRTDLEAVAVRSGIVVVLTAATVLILGRTRKL